MLEEGREGEHKAECESEKGNTPPIRKMNTSISDRFTKRIFKEILKVSVMFNINIVETLDFIVNRIKQGLEFLSESVEVMRLHQKINSTSDFTDRRGKVGLSESISRKNIDFIFDDFTLKLKKGIFTLIENEEDKKLMDLTLTSIFSIKDIKIVKRNLYRFKELLRSEEMDNDTIISFLLRLAYLS